MMLSKPGHTLTTCPAAGADTISRDTAVATPTGRLNCAYNRR